MIFARATASRLALLTSLVALSASCRSPRADRVTLYLAGSHAHGLDTRDVRIEPADNLQSAELDARGRLVLARRDDQRALHVSVPDRCPVEVPAGPQPEPLPLRAVLDLGGDQVAVGFGEPFTIRVRHNCPERGRGEISWQQLEGPPVEDWRVGDDGYALSGATARFESIHPGAVPQGIVPISPRTQGRVVLQARWRAGANQAATAKVAIAATPRATGLPSVAVSQQLLLSGADWRVQQRPYGGHARVVARQGLSFFTADAPGRWTLAQQDQRMLTLHALRHDLTPYDCGRAECHAEIAALTATSPMSRALSARLGEALTPDAASCMLRCHVVGEPGVADGGFHSAADRLRFTWTQHTRFDDLPQPLRRLGGVRCTACHGPGAIPPPGGRVAVLRADVCATCHDAPPRYVHVQQWRRSRMASADRHAGSQELPCARCHTTAGFLARIGARAHADEPAAGEPVGIACAACHAPHASPRGDHLVRGVPRPEAWSGDASASDLCLACHGQEPGDALAAPSGALWSGEIRVPAGVGASWQLLHEPGAHADVQGGCLGCHGGGEPGRSTRAPLDHSFRAAGACASCHVPGALQVGRERSRRLMQRASSLAAALAGRCDAVAPHYAGHAAPAPAGCPTPSLERARFEVALVLEDPAAAVHNGELSLALLSDAQARLAAEGGE